MEESTVSKKSVTKKKSVSNSSHSLPPPSPMACSSRLPCLPRRGGSTRGAAGFIWLGCVARHVIVCVWHSEEP